MNIGNLVATIDADYRSFTSGLHEAQTGLLQLDRSTQGVSRNVGGSFDSMVAAAKRFKVGVVAAVGGAGLSIGYMVSRMTSIGMELENSLAIAGGIMRATADEMAQMTEVAKAMGGATEFSSAQAAEALKFLGQAGFNVQQAVAALPGTLDLATAGQLDLARSADIASGALLAMQLPIDQLSRVNDVFIGTANRASTDIELMTESFKYAAPIAAAYGYTIEELSALIGVLGSRQIKGSMAGTQLAMSIQKAYQYAREMGLEGTKLLDVLDHLSKSGKDLKDIIPEVFDLRSSRAALTLAPLTDDVRDFTKELENAGGEAKTLANIMRNTTKTLKAELESAIESVAEDSFGKYRDELRDLIWATATWFRENKGEIVAVVETVTAGVRVLGSAVGGVVEILGGGLQGLTAFAQIEQEARDADGVLKSLEKSAAAVVDRATGKNRDDLAQIAEELVASAKELKALGGSEEDISRLEGTFSQLKTAAERLKITVTGLDGNFDTMARSIDNLSASARQLQQAAAPPDLSGWTRLGNLFEGLTNLAKNGLALMLGSVVQMADFTARSIVEIVETAINDLALLGEAVWGLMRSVAAAARLDAEGASKGLTDMAAALDNLKPPDFGKLESQLRQIFSREWQVFEINAIVEFTRIKFDDETADTFRRLLEEMAKEGILKTGPPPPPPKGGGAGDGDGEEGEPFGKFPEADAKLLAIYDQIRKAGTLAQEDLIAISEKASALRLEQLAAELDAVKKVTAEERQIILAAEEDRLQRESEDLAVAPIKQRLQAESQAYEQILQLDTLTAAQREDIWGKLADTLVAHAEMAADEIGRHSEEAAEHFRSYIPDMVGAARESYITDRLRSDLQEFDSILSQMLTANNLAADQMAAVWDQREAFAGRKIDLETEAFARLARSVGLVESAVIDLTYAYREYAEAALEASRDAARMGQLEAAAGPLQSMLESDSLTQDEQFVVRGAVKQIGAERIDLEVKALANLLRALGMEEEQVGKLTAAYERLEGEELDALGKAAKGMWDLADVTRDAVESMHDALTNGFLRALEGEFVKFRDFVRAVAQDIARSFAEKYMDKFVEWGMDQLWEGAKGLLGGDSEADTQAQINAEKVKGIALTGVETAAIVAQTGAVTGLAGAFMMLAAAKSAASMGGGDAGAFTNWLFSGDAVAFAEGGLVDRPTLALIGEAGPEVVVPVAEMENARFWKRLGLDMPTDRSLTENIDRWLQPEVGKALIDDLPAYGSGGIVTSPQVALIGEAGPEAIVPLGDFRRSTFWDGMRGTEGRRQQERPVRPITIHMNVNTPDLPSFQASRQQIVSQLSVALRKAGRNV